MAECFFPAAAAKSAEKKLLFFPYPFAHSLTGPFVEEQAE
jgi:hypothetical protein